MLELIDRYVHVVGRRIPGKLRADIEKELRSLVLDALEARTKGREPKEEDVVATLREMGSPAKVAAKYNAQEHGLIGPALLESYHLVLKVVLGAVALGLCIAAVVGIVQKPFETGALLLRLLGNLFSAGIGVVGAVTIVFAVIERTAPDFRMNAAMEKWNPKDLPPVPKKQDTVKISESIATMVFIGIGIVLFNFFLGWLGFYGDEAGVFIPVFDAEAVGLYLPYWNALWALEFLRHAILLIQGRERLGTRVFSLVLPVLSILMIGFMLAGPAILSNAIAAVPGEGMQTVSDILAIVYRVALILGIIGSVVDIGKRIYGLVKSLM